MLLEFVKTAVHPFTPERTVDGNYRIFTPSQIRLLAGQQVTVDFLLAAKIPTGFRAALQLRPCYDQKLLLHALPICKRVIQDLHFRNDLTLYRSFRLD
jgi:hypothetical protein